MDDVCLICTSLKLINMYCLNVITAERVCMKNLRWMGILNEFNFCEGIIRPRRNESENQKRCGDL